MAANLGLILFLCVNMGDGGKYGAKLLEPSFAALEEGQGSYRGRVFDETSKTEIRDLSFFGHTSVGGILKESDDSTNRLELSKIKEIHVIKPVYDSRRYSDKDVIFAMVTTIDGTKIKDLLFPKHIVICGVEKKTNMEKSWFIGKINKIIIDHEAPRKEIIPVKKVAKTPVKFPVAEKEEEPKTIWGTFIGVIDSIIDGIKAVFGWLWNLRKL